MGAEPQPRPDNDGGTTEPAGPRLFIPTAIVGTIYLIAFVVAVLNGR